MRDSATLAGVNVYRVETVLPRTMRRRRLLGRALAGGPMVGYPAAYVQRLLGIGRPARPAHLTVRATQPIERQVNEVLGGLAEVDRAEAS